MAIDRDKYEPLMKTMKSFGVISSIDSREEGFATLVEIKSEAVRLVRLIDAEQEEARAPRDLVDQVTSAVRSHPWTAWPIIALLALVFLAAAVNQVLELLDKIGWLRINP